MSSLAGVGPASVMVGNLVAGKRIAQAAGRDLGQIEENDLVRKVSVPGVDLGPSSQCNGRGCLVAFFRVADLSLFSAL